LVNGDTNSSYFQRRANVHRKKQHITKIKDDVGGWIDHQHLLTQKFLDDYMKRFKLTVHNTRQHPNLGLPKIIIE